MPPSKKKKKNKNVSVGKDDPNVIKPWVTFEENEDDSQDSDDINIDDFTANKCIKSNFTDEFDLFKHFFKFLRRTGKISHLIRGVYKLSDNEPRRLFELETSNFSSDPKFVPAKFTENDNDLFNVCEKISIKFDDCRTRYAEAKKKIDRAEILSVEKAIVLTDKPNSTEDGYSVYRCHHCLRVIGYFVTCPHCDVTIFCSYACRNTSWYEYHAWECYGLQRNFWSTSSVEYLALRILFLGARYEFDTGDENFDKNYEETTDVFNDPQNAYKYIYKLPLDLKKKSKDDLGKILITISGLLVYLVEFTRFFSWLSKLPKFENMKAYEMYMYIGGMLLRHYLQAEQHQVQYEQIVMVAVFFFDRLDFVSTGIFLSESIFSNNCKPNAIFCIRDNYVIVKATESIEAGQKITVNWHPSRGSCNCGHCLRLAELNSFLCMECKGGVLPEMDVDKLKYLSFDYDDIFKNIKPSMSPLKCKQCKTVYELEVFEIMNGEGHAYVVNYKQSRNIEVLQAAIEEYKNLFQPTHVFQSYLYIMALEYYINNDITNRPDEFADFMTKYLVVVELQFGKYSKSLLCGRCSMLLHILEMYTGIPLPPVIAKVCRHLMQTVRLLGNYHCIPYKIAILEQIIKTNYKNFNM